MKIIVTGGRDLKDQKLVFGVLGILAPTCVVHGGATGADRMAHDWCKATGMTETCMPANWDRYGKGAGKLRNTHMILTHADADLVVVFPGGTGTADCAEKADIAGLNILDLR